MNKVVWRNAALEDLDHIAAYIRQFDHAASDRIVRRLLDCGNSLATFPARGRPVARGEREMTIVPPYVLTYRIEDGEVQIVGVRHGAQRPRDDRG